MYVDKKGRQKLFNALLTERYIDQETLRTYRKSLEKGLDIEEKIYKSIKETLSLPEVLIPTVSYNIPEQDYSIEELLSACKELSKMIKSEIEDMRFRYLQQLY